MDSESNTVSLLRGWGEYKKPACRMAQDVCSAIESTQRTHSWQHAHTQPLRVLYVVIRTGSLLGQGFHLGGQSDG